MRHVGWCVLGGLIAAGCGGDDKSAPTKKSPPSGARRGVVAKALAGDWTRNYSQSDARKAGVAYLPGRFTMRFKRDGTWEVYAPGTDPHKSCLLQENCIGSTAKADATTVTLGEFESCVNPAVYSYRIRGDKLTMKRIKEDCTTDDRTGLFGLRVWLRAD